MKYSININQFSWSRNGFTSLDIVDLAILDAIKTFILSERAEAITTANKVYYWVSPNLLIEELPILGITTTRGINKRIDNLIEAQILERCPENQSAKRTYIRMGRNFNKYEYFDANESSSLGTNVPTPLGTIVPTTINTNNNNTLSLEEKREQFKVACQKYIPQYGEKMVAEFVHYWSESDGKKLRCEIAKKKSGCFEIGRRLATWASKEYNRPIGSPTLTPINREKWQESMQERKRKPPWEEMGFTQEQYAELFKK